MKTQDTDNRGVSPIIGFILVVGMVFVLIAMVQLWMVPAWNQAIDFEHHTIVQQDTQAVSSQIESVASTGKRRSTAVELGAEYPNRPFLLNPLDPSGHLHTSRIGDGTLSLRNITTPNRETADYWNGSEKNFSTLSVVYDPTYSQYHNAPDTVYENSVTYNRFEIEDSRVRLSGNGFISGRRITLVTVNGSYSQAGVDGTRIDIEPLSAPYEPVAVTGDNTTRNVTVTVPTDLPEEVWEDVLADEMLSRGGYIADYSVSNNELTVDLVSQKDNETVTYDLRMAKVGVGSDTSEEEQHYLTTVDGDNATVLEGGTHSLVVQTRDRFNNHVSGVAVNFSASSGNLSSSVDRSDSDGTVITRYEAPEIDGSDRSVTVNASMNLSVDVSSSGFDPRTKENATFSLTVLNSDASGTPGGGGGNGTDGDINPAEINDVRLVGAQVGKGKTKNVLTVTLENTGSETRTIERARIPFYFRSEGVVPPTYADVDGNTTDRILVEAGYDDLSNEIVVPGGAQTTFDLVFDSSPTTNKDWFVFRVVFEESGEAVNYFVVTRG